MAGGDDRSQDRVPKAYRHRLHQLKNAYRRAYRMEPGVGRPTGEAQAAAAVAFLERALRLAGVEPPPPARGRSDAEANGAAPGPRERPPR